MRFIEIWPRANVIEQFGRLGALIVAIAGQ
jgi:hypothetical protein